MNSIFFNENEIDGYRCITVYLPEKINENIFDNTLIKLGLISIEISNSKNSEKYYYFKLNNYKEESSYKSIINNSIRIDIENSCIYINALHSHMPDGLGGAFAKLFRTVSGGKENINIYKEICELLYNERIINIDINTSSYVIPNIDINNIIKEIKLKEDYYIDNGAKHIYTNEEWDDDSRELSLIKHFIKFLMDKYKEELYLSENNSKNEAEKEENKKLNIEKLNPIIKQCENKINEIKEIIKDFDYSDKKTYEEATSKIEKDLEELENKDISVSRVNEIIDEINETYRNAYKKKNNVSALSYIMETDEDIDLIKKIDIDNL